MKNDIGKSYRSEIPLMAFSVKAFATSIGVSERTVRQEIANQKLAHVRVGRRVLITTEQAFDYLKTHCVETFDAARIAADFLKADRHPAAKRKSK